MPCPAALPPPPRPPPQMSAYTQKYEPAYSLSLHGTPPPNRFGIENKDALMLDCGVRYLWFAFVWFLFRSPPPPHSLGSS